MNNLCPCGSHQALNDCCGRYHAGTLAPDAERLMRSRYSAYVLGVIDYLLRTTLPVQQAALDHAAIVAWSQQSEWLGLEVNSSEQISGTPPHAWVTFTARWRDSAGEQTHQERSAFVQVGGHWHFIDPSVPLTTRRNDPCPCAGGQKFKKCCAPYLT